MADVKIDIPGLGEITANNAASESTLKEIAKLLAGKGVPQSPTDNGDKKNTESKKKNTAATKESTGAVKAFGGALTGVIGGALNGLLAGIGAVVGTLPGLAKELAFGGQQLTDFAQHLPIPGLASLTNVLDQQAGTFRELSTIGAGFGNNMFELTKIAGEAAIPQRDFAALIAENTVGMRIFGGTVQDGAKRFAGLSKELRQSPIGQRMMELGFTSQDLNENFLSYSEMMQVSGRRSNMTNKQLIDGSLKYSSELDKISRLTGKSRKDLEAEMKSKNLDIRRQMAINKHGEEFGLRLQQLSATSPQLEAALLDMADGVANDPLTQQLMANNETFRTQAQNVQNMTAEQANNFIAGVRKDGVAFTKTMGDAGVQASIAAGSSVGAYAELTGELGRIQKTTTGVTKEEQDKRDAITAKMGTFAETVATVQGNIQAAIVDSGIFQSLSDDIAGFLPTTEEAQKMYEEASKIFKDNILPSLNSTWEWLKGDGITNMKKGIGNVIDFLKDMFLGKKVSVGPPGGGAEERQGGLFKVMGDIITTISDLWKTHGPAVKKFFTNLFSDPGQFFSDYVAPKLKEAFGALLLGIGFAKLGIAITKMLVKALINLNPWVKIAGLLIAGISMFIDWDQIKQFFSVENLKLKIQSAWKRVTDGFSNLFSWESIKAFIGGALPDGKLGDWARGKLGIGANDPPTGENVKNPTKDEVVEKPSSTTSTSDTTGTLDKQKEANTEESSWWESISTKLEELINVNKDTKKATQKLNGNINGG
tara:strand:- start:486 stop:2777 length:2292 start_codon:yes stop_codon:yes gene_type:complete